MNSESKNPESLNRQVLGDELYRTVEHNLSSARSILLTIILISSFLFILVFQMMFGWQQLRPSASELIFAENLAALAKMDLNDTSLSTLEKGIILVARRHCEIIVGSKSFDFHLVYTGLSKFKPWHREEALRAFVSDCENLETTLLKDVENSSKNGSTSVQAAVKKLSMSNYEISFCFQEISDRKDVNDQTRQKRVSARQFSIPIIGMPIQVEDSLVPISLILVILTYWLYTGVVRAYDSGELLLDFFRPLLDSQKSEESEAKYMCMRRIANLLQFAHWKKREDKPFLRSGVIWLYLAPYIVVASALLANVYEESVVDFRFHGSNAFYFSSIFASFDLWILFVSCAMVSLAILGFKMFRRNVKMFRRLTTTGSNGTLEEDCILGGQFCLGLSAPFMTIGTFGSVHYLFDRWEPTYFPSGWALSIILPLVISYGVITMNAYKFKLNRLTTVISSIVAFGLYPTVLSLVCLIGLINRESLAYASLMKSPWFAQWMIIVVTVIGLLVIGVSYICLLNSNPFHFRSSKSEKST